MRVDFSEFFNKLFQFVLLPKMRSLDQSTRKVASSRLLLVVDLGCSFYITPGDCLQTVCTLYIRYGETASLGSYLGCLES